MEPKSIAFYTAVAVSILAVLSATTFPTMAQAQETDTQETQEQTEQEDNDVVTKQTDSESNEDVNDQTDSQEEESNSANSNDNAAASERLGLRPNSGIASCGQVVTQDVTLTSDLNCDNGDGLIVGASDITINLNGYSITSGDETGSESPTQQPLAMRPVQKVQQQRIMMAVAEYWLQMQRMLPYQVLEKYLALAEESHS